MLIIPAGALRIMQEAVVKAMHSIVDQNGQPVTIGTVEDARLNTAALTAVIIAAGNVVWPGDQQIDPPDRVRDRGPFGRF